jgi:hypothetical protein
LRDGGARGGCSLKKRRILGGLWGKMWLFIEREAVEVDFEKKREKNE